MSKKVLIIPGWGGSDDPHWQAWLASELAKDYGCVNFFKFSNFEYPQLDTWSNELLDAIDEFKPNVIVCHSLANTLWFHLCNEKKLKGVEELFLVAPPSMSCDIPELKSFFPIKTPKTIYASRAILVSSTNDPYMSIDEAKKVQSELGIEMKILENAGHINDDSGFGEWPWILEQIKN